MRKITTTYKQFYDLLNSGDKTKYYVKTPTGFSKINAACEKITDTYYVEFDDNLSFIVGDRHMFMDRNGNPIAAMDFKPGDVIQTERGLLSVKSKNFHKKNELMYDISIDAPHWYISDESDGIYHHNTMLGFYGVKAYLDKYPDAVCLFYDSEFGANQSYFAALNIDTDRIIHIPITNIEEMKFDIVQRLEQIERGDKVFIMIDSIGNLASKREVENALAENGSADMVRPKEMKSFFRIITPHITMKDLPCVIINHVYKETGLYAKTVVGGGTGVMYSANTVFIISKAQEKVGTDIVGYNFTINIEKSRFVREKSKMTFQVLWDEGINKYSGLMDIALESGHVIKPSQGWMSRVNKETGEVEEKKYRLKDTYTEEFWGDILKSPSFQNYVKKRFQIGAGGSSTEASDEDMYDEEE